MKRVAVLRAVLQLLPIYGSGSRSIDSLNSICRIGSTISPVILPALVIFLSFFADCSHGKHAGITRTLEFNMTYLNASPLCQNQKVVSVNGQLPGPTIHVNEGDRLIIKVTNLVKYNVSIHWHGIKQIRSGWFDGPAYVTQCPIQQGQSYTYNFTVVSQSGTLWWHAHITWLRASVHGAFIIHPKRGAPYPFPQPHKEVPIVLGEWWNANVEDVAAQALSTGGAPNISDAYTINGKPGPLYKCSSGAFTLDVIPNNRYLLRIVNAALNNEMFFAVANHTLTVVDTDATYVKPFNTSAVLITPGQTMTVLLEANQSPGHYFMATHPYITLIGVPFDNSTATAILRYKGAAPSSAPAMAPLPEFNDTGFATAFDSKFRSMSTPQYPVNVPQTVDRDLFFTIGLAVKPCSTSAPNKTCAGPNGGRIAAAVNNVSFVLPSVALLQAHFFNMKGVFSADLPDRPVIPFNFTGKPPKNLLAKVGTRVSLIPYGENVQLVLQDTSILATENHPIHIHGFNFFVVGKGLGNFKQSDNTSFNLVDPPQRNTVGVPAGGWVALRFKADNPGVWFMHCHLEIHNSWGLETAFIVQNGKHPLEKIDPPPSDLPKC